MPDQGLSVDLLEPPYSEDLAPCADLLDMERHVAGVVVGGKDVVGELRGSVRCAITGVWVVAIVIVIVIVIVMVEAVVVLNGSAVGVLGVAVVDCSREGIGRSAEGDISHHRSPRSRRWLVKRTSRAVREDSSDVSVVFFHLRVLLGIDNLPAVRWR